MAAAVVYSYKTVSVHCPTVGPINNDQRLTHSMSIATMQFDTRRIPYPHFMTKSQIGIFPWRSNKVEINLLHFVDDVVAFTARLALWGKKRERKTLRAYNHLCNFIIKLWFRSKWMEKCVLAAAGQFASSAPTKSDKCTEYFWNVVFPCLHVRTRHSWHRMFCSPHIYFSFFIQFYKVINYHPFHRPIRASDLIYFYDDMTRFQFNREILDRRWSRSQRKLNDCGGLMISVTKNQSSQCEPFMASACTEQHRWHASNGANVAHFRYYTWHLFPTHTTDLSARWSRNTKNGQAKKK